MTRRTLLRMLLGGTLTIMMLPQNKAEASLKQMFGQSLRKQRTDGIPDLKILPNRHSALLSGSLSFHNAHTGDCISIRYLNENGQLDGLSCRRLNHFFRCHQTGRETNINPKLFLLLDAVRNGLRTGEEPLLLYSGYRSPAYNRLLARCDRHVARNSFHTKGMAADVALPGVSLGELERLARNLGVGGVGRYGEFVHIDIGPVRHW